MKICVCVKHVPDTAAVITLVGRGFDESVKFVMSPYDEYAVEEAVRIVERSGGEVVAVTLGKEAAAGTLRAALAAGADRGIHIRAEAQFLDSHFKAQAIKRAMERDGPPDLILTGRQSADSEGMQFPYWLAAALGFPVATEVAALSLTGRRLTVEREIGGGARQVLELELPCVISATRGLNQPRYPKMMDLMKAKKKPVREVRLADLGVAAAAAKTELVRLEPVPDRGKARLLGGTVGEMAAELLRLLREEQKVL